MPNRDNWQGDVLRDLRATPPRPPGAPASEPGPGTPPASERGPGTLPATAPGAALPEQGAGVPEQATYARPAGPPGAPGGGGYASGAVSQASQARPTPDARPVVDGELADVGRQKPRRGESAMARAMRAVRRTVSGSAAREVAETTRTAKVLQQPVTTGRQIAVTSIRGGAGKSTLTALLGTAYAHYRKDPVLFVEADPALGSLPLRLGGQTLRWTTGDIASLVEPHMSLLDITGYLVQLPGNAWLLPGSQGQIGAMLDPASYGRAMVALRRYFGVTVVDCETLPAEVARVALYASHARVLATPATLEGVTSTHAVLQWMRGLPRQVTAGTVVVLTEPAPHPGLDLDAAVKKLTATGVSVHVLPYDRHLAAGGTIRTELLARPTREAATRIAADVFQLSQQPQQRHLTVRRRADDEYPTDPPPRQDHPPPGRLHSAPHRGPAQPPRGQGGQHRDVAAAGRRRDVVRRDDDGRTQQPVRCARRPHPRRHDRRFRGAGLLAARQGPAHPPYPARGVSRLSGGPA